MLMRVAVAVSGRGSNLGALLDRLDASSLARVVLVLSNRPDAGALALARAHGIPAETLQDHRSGNEWLAVLRQHEVELVVLAWRMPRICAMTRLTSAGV